MDLIDKTFSDVKLCRVVYEEILQDKYHLSAFIDRFGGLSVFVFDENNERIYQGNNIISARIFIDIFTKETTIN